MIYYKINKLKYFNKNIIYKLILIIIYKVIKNFQILK